MSLVAAVCDFHDHLGVLVERGDVFPEDAVVVRRSPHHFEPVTGRRRTTSGGVITRTGGTAELVYGPPTSHPRRQIGVSRSRPRAGVTRSAETRPSWQIGPDPGSENWRLLK